MNIKKLLPLLLLFTAISNFAQNSATEISANDGLHYITTSIDYSITGIYNFKGAEPIVELNDNGTGFYQLHEQPKRPINWGIECLQTGEPKFSKGFDSAEYTFWYKYSDNIDSEFGLVEEWNKVEFSIHFNSNKMFINGERVKTFNDKVEK